MSANRIRGGRVKRAALLATSLGAVTAVAAGCGADSIPLPGGPNIGKHPMSIDIRFGDVLDLVPQSSVKVEGVAVGRVDKISIAPDNAWEASVQVLFNDDVKLPHNAHAEVKQTNLLGEKYIELSAPKDADSAPLKSGDKIPRENTQTATEVEQVLGALSLLLNGGGVAQLQPIVVELNKTLDGREGKVRDLLDQANILIKGLDDQVGNITRALDSLDTLTSRVSQQTTQISKILDELPAGIKILNEQRPQLIQMLQQLDRVGQAGFDVLNHSKDNLITDLSSLRPTLQALGDSAGDLVTAFPLIPTYPFPDEAIKSAFGGQVNTWLSVDLQIGTLLSNLGVGKQDPVYLPPTGRQVNVDPTNPYYNGNGPRGGWPTVSLLPLPPTVARPTGQAGPTDPLGSILEQLGVGGPR
ncbi:MCE family protein [Nocardia seriolae]|uniref:MCE family protein n=1 Tax=Nocardia seriolae TaxID=37332 RepID=UPI00068A9327|nr:MCE family protein [Nocardia seriolae]MTJ60644.1 MCE family protein [Nocardia seriolae]MTJ73334.1 MCE family protein [Nocardia seriolae]MTJ84483.1 MCE family protein [Nocardia seriolae]MTK28470.1 MCE family protein [Nocardia seriolae]MTK38632.1 MCE family protein [Nocardia seriolae]